jgi:hypothetical protein
MNGTRRGARRANPDGRSLSIPSVVRSLMASAQSVYCPVTTSNEERIDMKKMIGIVAMAMAALGMANDAKAGQKDVNNVYITTVGTSVYAGGDMGVAANSTDNLQELGCAVSRGASSTLTWCWATDQNGVTSSCSTYDLAMADAVHAINSDSHVYFYHSTSSATCTNITVETGSQYQVKH